jgi:hypothetical protein
MATWNIWLLNKGEQPACSMAGLNQTDALRWLKYGAEKVFDGSDADAVMMCRSDKHPNTYLTKRKGKR